MPTPVLGQLAFSLFTPAESASAPEPPEEPEDLSHSWVVAAEIVVQEGTAEIQPYLTHPERKEIEHFEAELSAAFRILDTAPDDARERGDAFPQIIRNKFLRHPQNSAAHQPNCQTPEPNSC